MTRRFDAVIIGGGLAGSSAGIALARKGWKVLIAEKQTESRKVCGEFLSPSVWPVLQRLNAAKAVFNLGGTKIRSTCFTGAGHSSAETALLGEDQDFNFGYGISRQALDACLLKEAQEAGCEIARPAEISRTQRSSAGFISELKIFPREEKSSVESRIVINAAGRGHSSSPGEKIGFKAHFEGSDSGDQIRLFFFKGGYFGIVKIEPSSPGMTQINLCGILNKSCLQRHGADFDALLKNIAGENPDFAAWFGQAARKSDWVTCASLRHGKKSAGSDGIFHAGDSACFLEPFMGQGMTMALAGGLLLSGIFKDAPPTPEEISDLQLQYQKQLDRLYRSRLSIGNLFQHFMLSHFPAPALIHFLRTFPFLFQLGLKKSSKLCLPPLREFAHAV